ncbi:polysaccharide pyruvyl transferase family protein [Bacteroides sp. KG123]|uniref:polysaccharide pyruvyl transferase family protein n=1 Tax=unclassified Bacteroides TaxID=2646097 RepID=UPI003D7F1DC1
MGTNKVKKVAILTLPIHSNFGFIMQLYALQKALAKLGYDASTIQLKEEPITLNQRISYFIKSFGVKYILRRNGDPFRHFPNKKEIELINSNTWDFINRYCKLTKYISSIKKLPEIVDDYDVFIVGSDQVWRKRYSLDIPTYFFSFLPERKKRLAYAASFGISNNDYGASLTSKCRELLSKFEGVGVRESDAVNLCKDFFSIEAQQVLDPTMLLGKEDYEKLIEPEKVSGVPKEKYLLAYILDQTSEKEIIAEKLALKKGLKLYYIKPNDFGRVGAKKIDGCVYPHISTWLYAFNNADYIVTDSFHGSVFSILFGKEFTVFRNENRGNSRLISLMEKLDIKRFCYSESQIETEPLLYSKVKEILEREREESFVFLKTALDVRFNTP